MRTCEERLTELHSRIYARRAARLRRTKVISAGAFAACLVLVMLFAAAVSGTPVHYPNAVPGGAAASVFAGHAALGFVVVAVLAFCLGAMVTALCHRLRKTYLDEEKHDDREP